MSHPLEAQSEIHHEEPKDYSQFPAQSYSVHHLLQSQAAAWSHEAQSTLARTSSLPHMSTANWPRVSDFSVLKSLNTTRTFT